MQGTGALQTSFTTKASAIGGSYALKIQALGKAV